MKRTEENDVRIYLERRKENESEGNEERWNGCKRDTGERGTE